MFTVQASWIAPKRARLTTRAAKWAMWQVGGGADGGGAELLLAYGA